MQAVKFKDFKM